MYFSRTFWTFYSPHFFASLICLPMSLIWKSLTKAIDKPSLNNNKYILTKWFIYLKSSAKKNMLLFIQKFFINFNHHKSVWKPF